ncbi:MAG: hypothetical protein J7642_18015 [Cyanobacteria bacterium SBC]|nr:hypothetical protein [Cyanobacteria bacterium SBC]
MLQPQAFGRAIGQWLAQALVGLGEHRSKRCRRGQSRSDFPNYLPRIPNCLPTTSSVGCEMHIGSARPNSAIASGVCLETALSKAVRAACQPRVETLGSVSIPRARYAKPGSEPSSRAATRTR